MRVQRVQGGKSLQDRVTERRELERRQQRCAGTLLKDTVQSAHACEETTTGQKIIVQKHKKGNNTQYSHRTRNRDSSQLFKTMQGALERIRRKILPWY